MFKLDGALSSYQRNFERVPFCALSYESQGRDNPFTEPYYIPPLMRGLKVPTSVKIRRDPSNLVFPKPLVSHY